MTRPLTDLRSLFRPPARPAVRAAGRSRRVRAKWAVLAGVAAVLALNLGMNVALDTVKPEWRDPEYGHRLKQLTQLAKRVRGAHRPLVVALGSSQVEQGLSPDHLGFGNGPGDPVVYNFSQSGYGPVGEMLNLRRLLAAGVVPDFLVIEVMPALLADGRPADTQYIVNRLAAADLPRLEPYCADYPALRATWLRGRVMPWYTVRIWLQTKLAADALVPAPIRQDFLWTELRPGGWMPYYAPTMSAEERTRRTNLARDEYAARLADFPEPPPADRAYREILTLCRDRGIRTALLLMPESTAFRGLYRPGVRERGRAYLAALAAEFGAAVFDASEWIPDEMSYYDGHHLLGHGAEAFSRRLGAECIGPWVRDAKENTRP